MRFRPTRFAAALVASCLALLGLSPAAHAEEAEPAIAAYAWYWETQRNQDVQTPVGNIALEAPNPFCPTLPGGGGTAVAEDTCAQGRLPVEVVNGDYETPDKISAVTFDLTAVPVGSKVSKFVVTFLEAESGCYRDEDTQSDRRCENTDAHNAANKELQACIVNEIFGEGEARPYNERPKFECSPGDPVAKRKEVKNDARDTEDTDPDHVWTFDLTEFARGWVKSFSPSTSIMILPKKPKGDEQRDVDDVDWRVVLAGPKFPGGVKTKLEFDPPDEPAPVPPPPGVTGGGTTGTTGFGTTGGAGLGTTGGTGFGDTGAGVGTSEAPTGGTGEPVETGETDLLAGDETGDVEAIPGYVWLALLAGLVAFSLVRSVVLERTVGHRPDGVLAQIHRLNAERRGGEVAAGAAPAPLARLGAGLDSVRRGARSVGARLAAVGRKLPIIGRRSV